MIDDDSSLNTVAAHNIVAGERSFLGLEPESDLRGFSGMISSQVGVTRTLK